MGISHLDHLYAETRHWERSVDYWEGLGFAFIQRWGEAGHRAGRLEAGKAAVVLAEVAPDVDPALNVFFRLEDADTFTPPDGSVVTPLEATHSGTRWIRVMDPDGRVNALEEAAK